jgi:hypothetical protein
VVSLKLSSAKMFWILLLMLLSSMLKILCILLFPNYVHLFSEIMEIHVLWLHSSIFFNFFFSYKIIFITKLENIIFPSWKLQYFLQRWWKKKYEYRKVIFWTSNVIHRHCYGCSFASFNLISVISFQSVLKTEN